MKRSTSDVLKATLIASVLSISVGIYKWPAPQSVGVARSSSWDKVAAIHLEKNPTCACCGGTKKRQVHHIQPFHDSPELELEPANLITLCTDGPCNLNCHFVIGHLGNTKCSNPNVVQDAAYMLKRFSSRKCN